MGLDNGALVVSNKRKLTRDMLPSSLIYPFSTDFNDGIEIVYWRKCWGIRGDTLALFHQTKENDSYTEIDTPEEVISWIEVIASWLNEKKWEEEGNSIWSYENIRPILIQNIINLAIISEFMRNNSDVYLKFYDSY